MLVPTQTDPFLAEMEAKRQAQADAPQDGAEPDAAAVPDLATGEAAEEVAQPDPFADKYVLDKNDPYHAIMRLREQDEKFRATIDSYAGRSAKRRYEPEI